MVLSAVNFEQQTHVHLELHCSLHIWCIVYTWLINDPQKMYSLCSGHRSGDALSNFSRLMRLSSMQDKSIKRESTILIFFAFEIVLLQYYETISFFSIILCMFVYAGLCICAASNLIKQSINIKFKDIEINSYILYTVDTRVSNNLTIKFLFHFVTQSKRSNRQVETKNVSI